FPVFNCKQLGRSEANLVKPEPGRAAIPPTRPPICFGPQLVPCRRRPPPASSEVLAPAAALPRLEPLQPRAGCRSECRTGLRQFGAERRGLGVPPAARPPLTQPSDPTVAAHAQDAD